jgi:hypothetical protein
VRVRKKMIEVDKERKKKDVMGVCVCKRERERVIDKERKKKIMYIEEERKETSR